MARKREKPINEYMQRLMKAAGCYDAETGQYEIKKYSHITGIPYGTLLHYTDITDTHQSYESLIRDSYLAGVDPVDFMLGILGKASVEEVLEKMGVKTKRAS